MQRDISIFQIPVSHIEPHPQNPRKDLGDLTELCDSISKNGIMVAICSRSSMSCAIVTGTANSPIFCAAASRLCPMTQRNRFMLSSSGTTVRFCMMPFLEMLSHSSVRSPRSFRGFCGCGSICDTGLQAKCLEKAGTKEFENALRGAKWELETREFHNKFEAFMAGIGATIVNDRATGADYIGCCYNDCSNMKNVLAKVEETKIKYPDAVIVYTINGRDCSVYFKSKIRTEEIEKNRSKNKENDAAKEEIRDKARSLAKERWIWALRAIEAGEIASIDPIASVLAEELKDRYNWATKSEREKILNIAKTYPAIVWENPINVIILYLIAKDGGDVPYGFEKEPEIPEDTQELINALTAYGYEMTQEEKDFYEGKSELFDVFKDEEDEK